MFFFALCQRRSISDLNLERGRSVPGIRRLPVMLHGANGIFTCPIQMATELSFARPI